ncbi:MAG: DUF2723 domain-containing protein [Gemmatimonadota bacterium]|nr:DUF2723 domain-containing protein [Gemmatimonadota bacterium]
MRRIPVQLALAVAAAVTLITGYLDIWRGGTSLGACLLVLGYCVLLPATAWRSFARETRVVQASDRPPYAIAAIVGAAVLALYIATLAPTTAMWDTSEYIAVAKTLGLPHPPGNPLFVLLAHVAGLVPLPVSYAVRINLLAAVASACSAALWFLCAERVMREIVPGRKRRMGAAAIASLLGATAFTVWNQSVVNEKVYTVSLLGLALTSWLVVRWLDALASKRDASADRLLVIVAYVSGLAYAVHPAGLLVGPAIVATMLARRPATLLRWRLLIVLAAVGLAGVSPFALEPIRSAHQPMINEGAPTACIGGKPEIGCTFSAETAHLLMANMQREQYGGHPVLERQAPLPAQIGMWWLYFKWQWVRDADGQRPLMQYAFALIFFALGVGGLVAQRKRAPESWWYFATLAGTLTGALIFYLNFKYGWSQSLELTDAPHEVRERDYFFIWTFSLWGMLAAVGLASLWRYAADRLASQGQGERRAWAFAAPMLMLALVPLAANHHSASRAGQTFTREWAVDLLNSVEPYGLLVTNGDNDSFPLWYAQNVEGVRRDVTVTLIPYLGIPAYAHNLIAHPPETYDAARGPAIYRNREWKKPMKPIWSLTRDQLDSVPYVAQLAGPVHFKSGSIDALVPQRELTRDQLLVLYAIRDSFPDRGVYFSLGGYAQALGLGPYLRQQGLAEKLEPAAVQTTADFPAVSGAHLDIERTRALWDTVYGGASALIREGQWPDRASVGIPLAYAITGQQLAVALAAQGDSASADRITKTVVAIARAARLDSAR